jgi:hypothetical protein
MPGRTKARASGAEDADMQDATPPSAQQPVDSQEGADPMEEDEEDNGFVEEEESEEPQRVRIVSSAILVIWILHIDC